MAREIPAFKELEEVHKHNNKLRDDKTQMKSVLYNRRFYKIDLCLQVTQMLQYRTRINAPQMCTFTSFVNVCRQLQCN